MPFVSSISMPTASASGVLEAVTVGNFESDYSNWSFYNGAEYPGAAGSLTQDTSSFASGHASGRLHGDFSGGGAYVSIKRNIPAIDAQQLTLSLQTTDVRFIGVRLLDGTGQVHQQLVTIPAASGW